ncbi:MAG: MBL fold metallo-hydrolase [Candidatus Omnitrophica bacterium]|nr:MBL fold metallo-hydrolase [Candidatus Omnitrophota bacterium]
MTFYLKQMELGPMQNFVYLIGCPTKKEAAVVDPGWDAGKMLAEAERDGMKITSILISHAHFDHVNVLHELLAETDAKVYLQKEEVPFLKVPKMNLQPTLSGDKVRVGDIEIECIHTPGHTPGSQCFHVDGRLISGDTLFINACGRTDLPGGDSEQMYYSLTQRLARLPDETLLYPGHNYADRPTSTLKEERQSNPFLLHPSLESFLMMIRGF